MPKREHRSAAVAIRSSKGAKHIVRREEDLEFGGGKTEVALCKVRSHERQGLDCFKELDATANCRHLCVHG